MNPADFDDSYSVSPKNMSDEQIALRDAMTVTAVDQAESIAALSASLHAHLDGLCKSVERLERERNEMRAELEKSQAVASQFEALRADRDEICASRCDLVTVNHQLRAVLLEILEKHDIHGGCQYFEASPELIERAEKLLAGG